MAQIGCGQPKKDPLKFGSAASLLALVFIALGDATFAASSVRPQGPNILLLQDLVYGEDPKWSGREGLVHQIRSFPTSRSRPCTQDQSAPEYAACRATGAVRCATGEVSSGVVLDLTGEAAPGFMASAAHALLNENGTQRRDCFFHPYQWPDVRVPIFTARHQVDRMPDGKLDWESGDIAIARLGTVQVRRRGRGWIEDRSPVVDYTGALAIASPGDTSRLRAVVDPSIRQIGFDPQRREVSVSDNCTAYPHDPRRDNSQTQNFLKTNCSAPRGWSGGPLISTLGGQARLLCIQARESHPDNRADFPFNRHQLFNLCSPLSESFLAMASAFARESNQFSGRN